MLSRIAESLFWIGRYVERAESTSRILDVHVHRVLEDPWLDEESAGRELLAVMGVATVVAPVDSQLVTELLGYDRTNQSSIVGAISAARENARSARVVVSSEVWECLNATWNELEYTEELASRLGPHVFFRYIRERTAMLAGLVDATLARDDGWRFLVLGRGLERVDMTARLLSSSISDAPNSQSWVSLLRSCGAHESYLRTYRRAVDASRVAEFLLLDRLFPRSVYWSLALAEQILAELDSGRRLGRSTVHDAGRRAVGLARTELEFRDVAELVEDMPELLRGLQRTCSEVSAAVTARYFARETPRAWATEVPA
ncbi:alpha-E domain-containing protein [Frankia sp. CNm7]|uniref:Alpha-E domain-containing protein n=1 Tax=Frankia nepalensis TaxID=1836974 RepID=A0A937US98_9ACTN|nr:alpha-E domain-containing protein [Frankia nepalensis]MBL7502633.1 alpha-E domain-containing protein [Frankia nepalensis]MBL7519367.1 alpha-E domain-containing protein [Frankia nepalensis]MBL7632237.1 alpha-E domain-containing protein [Frankia nepalensis]